MNPQKKMIRAMMNDQKKEEDWKEEDEKEERHQPDGKGTKNRKQ
jgi:hypothetical protein